MKRLKQLSIQGQSSNLEWLNGYSDQTVEQLLSLEGKCRLDSLVLAFEQPISQKETRSGTSALTDEESIVLAVEALEREVNNGGYEQVFANSSREYAATIVDSLLRIGCENTENITRKPITTVCISDPAPKAIEIAMSADD